MTSCNIHIKFNMKPERLVFIIQLKEQLQLSNSKNSKICKWKKALVAIEKEFVKMSCNFLILLLMTPKLST